MGVEINQTPVALFECVFKEAVDYSQDNCITGTDLSAVRLYGCIVRAEGSRAS